MKIFVLLLAFLIFPDCSTQADKQTKADPACHFAIFGSETKEDYSLFADYFNKENLKKFTTIEMLLFLKANPGPVFSISADTCRFPKNWIKEEDCPRLLMQLNNTAEVARIYTFEEQRKYSSHADTLKRKSTIGNEALHLLNGYFTKQYPCERIVYDKKEIERRLKADAAPSQIGR